jgi:hypothetical protein
MKMTAYFYLNDKQNTPICTMYDLTTMLPYKVGDTFWYNSEELHPRKINELKKQYKDSFVNAYIEKINEKEKLRGKYKVVRIYNDIKENNNHDDSFSITYEFTCKKVKIIYWKFWKLYKFKKFFGLK